LRGEFGRERFVPDDGGQHDVVNFELVARAAARTARVEIVFDLDEAIRGLRRKFIRAREKDFVVAVSAASLLYSPAVASPA